MEYENKLKLYFFNPFENEDKYSQLFHTLSGQSEYVHYAPLYLLRRHILILTGMLFSYEEMLPPIHHVPYFSAILLANISISNLVAMTNYYHMDAAGKDVYDYPGFYLNYFGKNEAQLTGLRLLRNALEHNNFQLFTRVYKNNLNGTRASYNTILGHVKLESPSLIDSFKVAFALGRIKDGYFVDGPYLKHEYADRNYALVNYNIDPFRFLEKYEESIRRINQEINFEPKLQRKFDTMVTVDNWMKV